MLYGTEENAKKNIIIQQECMKKKTDYLYLAEKALTKDEFQQYIKVSKKLLIYRKKVLREILTMSQQFLEKSVYQKLIVTNYMHFMIKQNHLMTKYTNL